MTDNESCSASVLEDVASFSLRLNFYWSLVALVVYNSFQFGLVILLTRLGNSLLVGTFILAMAVCAPFQIIGSQLTSILATDVKYEFSFNNYLLLNLASGLLLILGAALAARMLNYEAEILVIVLIVAATKAIENLSYIFLGLMQMHERMDLFAFSLSLKGVLSLGVFWVLFHSSGNLPLSLLGLTGVGLLMLAVYDVPRGLKVGRQARFKHQGAALKDMVQLSQKTAPLGLSALLTSLNTAIPRFFLEHYSGLIALGYFGPIAYVLAFGDLVAAALGRAIAPRLARNWLTNRSSFQATLNKLLALLAALGLGASLVALYFGANVLTLLFGPDYAPYASVLFWLTVAMGFGAISQFFSFVLTAIRRLKSLAVLSVATLLATVLLCYLLTPRFGIWGTTWAICLGLLLRLAGSYLIYLKIVSRKPHWAEPPDTLKEVIKKAV